MGSCSRAWSVIIIIFFKNPYRPPRDIRINSHKWCDWLAAAVRMEALTAPHHPPLSPSLPSSLLVHAIGSHRCGSFHPDYLNSGNRWQGKHVVFLRLRGKRRKHMDVSDARAHAKTKKQKTQRPKKQMGLYMTDCLLVE